MDIYALLLLNIHGLNFFSWIDLFGINLDNINQYTLIVDSILIKLMLGENGVGMELVIIFKYIYMHIYKYLISINY